MIKSVNIDGKDYIIRSCEECPFYDWGDEGYGDHCQYPENPSKLEESGSWGMPSHSIAKDCPLGLVKECFSCKHDGKQQDEDVRCEGCSVWFHADTGIEDPPTKWEAKE